jgi:hypothetical protein
VAGSDYPLQKGFKMRHQIIKPDDANIKLLGIQEGMPVFDLIVDKLGRVKYVQFSDDSLDREANLQDDDVKNAPDPIRQRLLESGYIRVNTGLLHKDYFVTADQIEEVIDHGVYLHRLREELLTL